MAIAFRSIATYEETVAGTTVTANAPAGLADGDLIIVAIATYTTNGGTGAPAGWTLIGPVNAATDASLFVLYKIASSEGASWTFTDLFDGAEQSYVSVAIAYSGVDNSTPLDVAAVTLDNGAIGTGGEDTGTITPDSNNCMIVSICGSDAAAGHSGTADADPACTERSDYLGATYYCWVYIQEHQQAALAAEAHTITPSAAVNGATCILALRTAAAGGASIIPRVMAYYRRMRS